MTACFQPNSDIDGLIVMKMPFIIPAYHVDLKQLDACIDSIEVAANAPGAVTGQMVRMKS